MASKVEQTDDVGQNAIATLIVGNSYTYANIQFKAGDPKPVPVALAEELDKLKLTSADSRSKRKLSQDRFEIEWPEGYSPEGDEDEDDTAEASSGAKRPIAKKGVAKRPSRSK